MTTDNISRRKNIDYAAFALFFTSIIFYSILPIAVYLKKNDIDTPWNDALHIGFDEMLSQIAYGLFASVFLILGYYFSVFVLQNIKRKINFNTPTLYFNIGVLLMILVLVTAIGVAAILLVGGLNIVDGRLELYLARSGRLDLPGTPGARYLINMLHASLIIALAMYAIISDKSKFERYLFFIFIVLIATTIMGYELIKGALLQTVLILLYCIIFILNGKKYSKAKKIIFYYIIINLCVSLIYFYNALYYSNSYGLLELYIRYISFYTASFHTVIDLSASRNFVDILMPLAGLIPEHILDLGSTVSQELTQVVRGVEKQRGVGTVPADLVAAGLMQGHGLVGLAVFSAYLGVFLGTISSIIALVWSPAIYRSLFAYYLTYFCFYRVLFVEPNFWLIGHLGFYAALVLGLLFGLRLPNAKKNLRW